MDFTRDIYRGSLSLFTDLYQLTMAYAYWKEGIAEKESVFNLFFRENPFHGGYTITCGLGYVIDFLNHFSFSPADLEFIRQLENPNGTRMFDKAFTDYLGKMEFCCDIDAIPEGRAVFPNEPLVRVRGPILQAQLIESALLNMINYQSLVATKAARISEAAHGEKVLEFGLRRAQGIDGALCASRAAYIGGCSATSNVMAGRLFEIPVAGTHAHSWVMAFDHEIDSFKSYARHLPDNCIFLIDTYDTIQGVKNAMEVGKILEAQDKHLIGVRIDSGDLAYFSNEVRRLLDEGGFEKTLIVASNNLDEYLVASLQEQQSAIDIWGIGTKLVTGFDQPALGGVYKLAAIKNGSGWDYKIKLSEQAAKINNPGVQQVRRFFKGGVFVADMIYDININVEITQVIIDPVDHTRRKNINATKFEDLLVPIFRSGTAVYQQPDIHTIRDRVKIELSQLDQSIKRLVNPHQYSVGLEKNLYDLKTELVLNLRKLK
ncbi:MAG: nicotinate phosphoribosyltransferase [Cyclobacteriaceae bacterium]|nr:MAG: nicotinate phosphoribosyltransferase [Cyclobacteriaceae bacterium]